jgi:hypothetical protein
VDGAAEHLAGAAVQAAGPVPIGLRVDRCGQREGGVAERTGTLVEGQGGDAHGMGRIRIALVARRPKRIRGCVAGNAEVPLRLLVEGLEIRVAERPVGQIGAGNRTLVGEHRQLVGAEAPRPRRPVGHGPAHALGDGVPAPGNCLRVGGGPGGLELVWREKLVAHHDGELVVAELGS